MNKAISDRNPFADYFERSRFLRVLILLLILAASIFVIIWQPKKSNTSKWVAGQIAPRTVAAYIPFDAPDLSQIEQLLNQEPAYYRLEPDTGSLRSRYFTFFEEFKKREQEEKRGKKYIPDPLNDIQKIVADMSSKELDVMLRIADNTKQRAKFDALTLYSGEEARLYEYPKENAITRNHTQIRIIDPQKRSRIVNVQDVLISGIAGKIAAEALEFYEDSQKQELINGISIILSKIMGRGNLSPDRDFTNAKREETRNRLEKTIRKKYHAGEVIIQKGATVTEENRKHLEAYEQKQSLNQDKNKVLKKICGNILLCIVILLAMGSYLYHVQPQIARSNRSLWLLGLITIMSILLNRVCIEMFYTFSEHVYFKAELIYLAIPAGFASVLISVIYGVRPAIFIGAYISIVAALTVDNKFYMLLTGLLINAGGSLAVRRAQNYKSFVVRAFLGTALSSLSVSCVIFLQMLSGEFANSNINWQLQLSYIPGLLLFPLSASLLTAMLSQLALYIMEILFDVPTTMSLNLCTDFNHPVLKELQLKAPGTYHHCLMVSILAEQAAVAAGLDPVKARVCGMFHDIGKLQQPKYFIENNPGKDIHKDLDPTMSAMIILNHVVKHGPELARKYKLKSIIRDTIRSHHGTDLILYFYKKAQSLSPDAHIPESEFRYPGPLPSEKETALIMLADCCEAASRSLEHPSPAALEQLVNEIFRKKIRDGQLDEAQLTLNELAIIRKSFINTLEHINHGRIAYPKEDKTDEDDLFVAAGEKIPPSQ